MDKSESEKQILKIAELHDMDLVDVSVIEGKEQDLPDIFIEFRGEGFHTGNVSGSREQIDAFQDIALDIVDCLDELYEIREKLIKAGYSEKQVQKILPLKVN